MGMSYFIVFGFLFLLGIDLAFLFRKETGVTFAVANIAMILFLYVGGLFKQMDIGAYVFLAFIILLTACVAFKALKNRERLVSVLKNPITIFYLIVGISLGIIFIGKISADWDELSHWALVAKNMIATDTFGNLDNSTTMFNQYVPATGIFMYGFQIFNKQFINGNLYSAFNLLTVSMIIPITKLFQNKISFACIASLIVSLALPVVFKVNVYNNLLVDGILGVTIGYIFLAYYVDRKKPDFFTILSVGMGCALITLIKSSGIAMCIFALLFIAVDIIFKGKKGLKTFGKARCVFMLIVPILFMIGAKLSWSWYVDYYQVRAGWDSSEMNIPNIISYLSNPNEFQSTVTETFLKRFFIGDFFYEYGTYLNQPQVFAIALYFVASLLLMIRTKKRGHALTCFILSALVLVGYGVVLLLMYLFSFNYREGLSHASYPRYISTVSIGVALILAYQLIDAFCAKSSNKRLNKIDKKKGEKKKNAISLVVTCIIFAITTACLCPHFATAENKHVEPYEKWIQALEQVDEDESVYYAMHDYNGSSYHCREYLRIRYYATPLQCSGFNEGGSYKDGRDTKLAYTGNPFSINMSVEELTNELNNYDYFFIDKVSDKFINKFGKLFNGDIKAQTLYRVLHQENDKIILVYA